MKKVYLKRHELFLRYLLSYLAVLLVPLTLVGFIIRLYFVTTYRGLLVEQSASLAEKIQASLEMQTSQMYSFSMQCTGDPDFSPARIRENPASYIPISRKLRYFLGLGGFIEEIAFRPEGYSYFYTTAGTVNARYLFTATDGRELADAQAILDGLSGLRRPLWVRAPLYPDGGEGIFYLVPVSGGCFIYKIPQRSFEQAIADVPDSSSCPALLMGESGLLCGHLADTSFLGALPAQDAGGNPLVRVGGQQYYLCENSSPSSGLRLIFFIPRERIAGKVAGLSRIYFLCLLLILPPSGLIIFWQMKRCYSPVRELGRAARRAAPGISESLDPLESAQFAIAALGSSRRTPREEEMLRESKLFRLLKGEYSDIDAFNADCEEVGLFLSGSVFRVLVFLTDWQSDLMTGETRIFSQLQTMLSVDYEVFMLEYLEQQRYIFILSTPQPVADDVLGERLRLLLMHYAEAVGGDLTIGVSGEKASPAEIPQAYGEAGTAAQYQLVLGKNRVIFYSDSQQSEGAATYFYPKEELDSLYYAILNGNIAKIQFITQNLCERIRSEYRSLFLAICLCYDIINTALRATHEISQTYPSFEAKYLAIKDSGRLSSVEDFVDIVRQISEDIIAYLDQNRKSAHSIDATAVTAYIREHFADPDFCVKTLSDHFNMSISNFSHQFKASMDQNVSAYINNLRIGTAKSLLESTDLSVNDIALRIGYQQPSSFIRKFRQTVGHTPGEYRAACAIPKAAEEEEDHAP